MMNSIFEMSGFDKKTGCFERKIGKVEIKNHRSESAIREEIKMINKMVEKFKKTHDEVFSTGVVRVF